MMYLKLHFTALLALVLLVICMPVAPAHAAVDCNQFAGDASRCSGSTNCQWCSGKCISLQNLCLLEPLPGREEGFIKTSEISNLGAMFAYLKGIWVWAVSGAVAITVFQVVMAGQSLVTGGAGAAEKAKTQIMWAILGLLMLLLAGALLNHINPVGFTQ